MNELVNAAAEKAAQLKERVIAKRAKKRQSLAAAASKKATAQKQKQSAATDEDASSESSSSSSQVTSSSSDTEYSKKPKAKPVTKAKKGSQKLQNKTYAILTTEPTSKSKPTSGLSKAARIRQKKISRPHKTFFCAKIKVKSSSNSMEELQKKTKQWFDYLRQVDSTTIVYPFKEETPSSALFPSENIPDSLVPFRNYFHQANSRSREGHVWLNMYIGHTETVDDILREMDNYKNNTDTFTYVKKIANSIRCKRIFPALVHRLYRC